MLLDEFNQLEIKDKKVFHKLVRNLESFKNRKKIKGIYNSGGTLLWFGHYQSLNDKIEHVSFTTILNKKNYTPSIMERIGNPKFSRIIIEIQIIQIELRSLLKKKIGKTED